jgi:5-amino-6-(5-phospho-D-ribitylamino)uracil phosphatase
VPPMQIPIAVASTARSDRLMEGLRRAGIAHFIDVVVSADNVSRGRPDPEPYLFAAMALDRPPLRCVVIGSSNLSVEGAHDVGMQCIAVASHLKMYELTAADLVVRHLDMLSLQNLKQLFRTEEGRQPELQSEEETQRSTAPVALAEPEADAGSGGGGARSRLRRYRD